MISFEGASGYSTSIYPFGALLYIGTTLHINNVLDANKMIRITQLIQESFGYDFIPTGVFVATWDDTEVSSLYIPCEDYSHRVLIMQRNTVQCVLTTNGQDTFVFFLYADGLIQYDRLQIGIYGGDGVNYYTVPYSDITRSSNVNQQGLWVFKVDDYNIIGGVCHFKKFTQCQL